MTILTSLSHTRWLLQCRLDVVCEVVPDLVIIYMLQLFLACRAAFHLHTLD